MSVLFCLSAITANTENAAETALEAPTWLDFLHRMPWWPHWLPVQFAWFVITIILLAALCYFGTRKMQKIPRGLQNLLEMMVQALENFAEDNIGPGGKVFAPFLGTLFIFITVMNLLGLVPGFSSPTANLNTTLAMAVIVFFVVQYHGIKQGGLGYFQHFVGEPWWLFPLMLPLHLIAELTRPITLALRLRGNISGEDTAIFSFILLAAGLPIYLRWLPLQFPLMLLACLTSVIQAFVFILLAAVYLALASPEQAH
jgi:F-type H+-transporting ATPase subunit a